MCPCKRLPGEQHCGQLKTHKGLAGAPLAADQPLSNLRRQVLDQPGFERTRISISVRVQQRQSRIKLRLTNIFV